MFSIYIILVLCVSISADYHDCGRRFALNRYEPAISFGGKTLRSEFPWHVALYRQYSTEESAEYICGGSIIHPKVILTAAHCIYNETYCGIDNATFTIVAGKYYVSLEHTDPGEQRLKVVRIKIPITYVGFTNRYAEDIALLELNSTLKFTSAISPVCIDWNSEYLVEQLPTVGTVVGWGRTENNTTSDELLMANLKYIEFTKCRDRIKDGFSLFITSDKFCAGLDNGTSVQRGDSGGGITFPRNSSNNKEQHYIYGIISLKDVGSNNITAFTDIRKHLPWLNITLLSIINPGLFEVGQYVISLVSEEMSIFWITDVKSKSRCCPPFPSKAVSLLMCSMNGTSVDCNRSAKLGTKAKLHCKNSYHYGSPFHLYSETECSAGFKWVPLHESCIVCGKRYRFNGITPLAKYKLRTVSEYPWHVALYRKLKSKPWELICGGTIIHPKAVITAAHCVYDEYGWWPTNKTKYSVAVGKFNSNWDEQIPMEQRFEVKKMHIIDKYQGQRLYYANDIAVLELNGTIKLSDYIMPVCMDWGGKLDLHKNPLIVGTTQGWGFTEEGKPSDELRASKLSYANTSLCIEHLKKLEWSRYFKPDKFCAISTDGSIPDRGDSGGSLTFPYYDVKTSEELNYLFGIVSTKPGQSDDLLAFTNVTYHLEWIKTVLLSIINNSGLH